MAAFTTTSPASKHIITALFALVIVAMAGLAGSYLVAYRDGAEPQAATSHAGADVATNIRPAASS